jgi:sugar lactone lactonase YvrE
MFSGFSAELVFDARDLLGEGRSWDVHTRGRSCGLTSNGDSCAGIAPSMAGGASFQCRAARARSRDAMSRPSVVAVEDGVVMIDARSGGQLSHVPVAPEDLRSRMNDGKCDRAGRFWAGTMALDDRVGANALYRLDPDLTVTRALSGVTLSNGLDWSPDGRTMYYIDTPTQGVDAFDGALDAVVRLPVTQVTSCCFGGRALDELFTSARIGLNAEELAGQPLAGGVFRARPGSRGLAAGGFAPSS